MTNQGKFLIFAGAIILLAMLAGGSNTRNSFAPPPTTGPNCYFQSDGYCSALGSFHNALDAAKSSQMERELERFRNSPEGRQAVRDLQQGIEKAERQNRAKGWIDNPYERSGN